MTVRLTRTLLLSLLLASCSRRDAQLSHQIAGAWNHDYPGTPVVLTINSDGSFTSKMWYQNLHPNQTNTWSGTWQISDGVFIVTCTRSNDVPVASVSHCKIIHLDAHDLTCEIDYLANGTISYRR